MLSAIHDRRPWFAALLSFFLTPAVGMAYLNRGWFAALYLALLLAAIVLLAVLYPALGPESALPLYVAGVIAVITLGGAAHAAWIARWYDPSRRLRWYARYWHLLALASFLWLAAGWILPFGYQSFHAASASMLPTLQVGDHVLVSKFRARDFQPQSGDVVVYYNPEAKAHFLKRVVGLPGDSIQIQAGVLFVNGVRASLRRLADTVEELCDRKDCAVPRYEETLPGGHKAEILKRMPFDGADSSDLIIVPADSYFVLGDDRDNSSDSRHAGPVARRNLVGRVVLRYITGGRWTWRRVN